MSLKKDETLIPIKKFTREKLKNRAKKSQTYDDFINELLEKVYA